MRRGKALFAILFLAPVLLIGCSGPHLLEEFLAETKVIKLDNPAEAARAIPVAGGFLLVGWKDASIRMIDENGAEKALYSRKGKGPGELQDCRLEAGGLYKGVLMVADQSQNRIMLFSVDEQRQKIGFLHSFPVDKGGISSACFDREGRILVYTPLGESEYLLYSLDGELLEQWPGSGSLAKRGSRDPEDLLRWIGVHENGVFAVSYLSGRLRSCLFPWTEGKENRVFSWMPRSPLNGKASRLVREAGTVKIEGGVSIEGAVMTKERLYVCVRVPGEKGRNEIQGYDLMGRFRESYRLPSGADKENIFLLGIMSDGAFIMGSDGGEKGGLLRALVLMDKRPAAERDPRVAFLSPASTMAE